LATGQQSPPPRQEVPVQYAIILPNPGSDKKPTWLSILENSLELTKVFVWPALILVILSLFYAPIRDSLEQLPTIVSQAQKISVGSLSVEVQAQARQIGGTELASALQGLSSKAIEKVLLTGRTNVQIIGTNSNDATRLTLPGFDDMKAFKEVESKRLLTLRMERNPVSSFAEFETAFHNLPLAPDYSDADQQTFVLKSGEVSSIPLLRTEYKLTPLGLAAFDSVVNAVSHQLSVSEPQDMQLPTSARGTKQPSRKNKVEP